MFGSTKKKEQEVERLSDSFKEKISELHLLIKSGTLSPEELAQVESALTVLRRKLAEQMDRGTEARRMKP